MNLNFCVDTDLGLMVYRLPRSPKKNRGHMERIMLSVLADTGFPCPNPVPTKKQHSLLYPLLPGHTATKATSSLMREVGMRLGEIHKQFLSRKQIGTRERWDPADIKKLIRVWRPKFKRARYPKSDEFLSWIESELSKCEFPKHLPTGWTHQDFKPENTLVKNGSLSGVLDFDNAYEGALIHDVTTSIIWWCFPKNKLDKKLLSSFLKGYESRRRLTAQEKKILLKDALRFRLLREMFIGPMTTLDRVPFAVKRANHFRKLYNNTF